MFAELPQPKMRWRYFEPGIPSEEAERARVESRIAAWWSDFAVMSSDLDAAFKTGGGDWDRIAPRIDGHLTSITNDNVSWEFGPGEDRLHRISLTAGWDYWRRPMLETIAAAAPPIPLFEAEAGLPACSGSHAEQLFAGRQKGVFGGESLVALSSLRFRVERFAFNSLRFDVAWPKARRHKLKHQLLGVLAVRLLLGEEMQHRWLGRLQIESSSGSWWQRLWSSAESFDASAWLTADELRARSLELIAAIDAELPQQARFAIPSPERAPDEPIALQVKIPGGTLGRDRNIALGNLHTFVALPETLEQVKAIGNGLFQSRRFSRVGETFCYLKLVANPEDWSAMELAESLDRVLRHHEVGSYVWSGEGPETDYVGLALTDVQRAMVILRGYLQGLGVDRRGWLLFLDAELDQEWLGVWPDTPAPKLPVASPLGG